MYCVISRKRISEKILYILFIFSVCNLIYAEPVQKICGQKLTKLIENTYYKATRNDCNIVSVANEDIIKRNVYF